MSIITATLFKLVCCILIIRFSLASQGGSLKLIDLVSFHATTRVCTWKHLVNAWFYLVLFIKEKYIKVCQSLTCAALVDSV